MILLRDILGVMDENEDINVRDSSGLIISRYNGRDSIDGELLDCVVTLISSDEHYGAISIYVKTIA